jgi:hypothetical protein
MRIAMIRNCFFGLLMLAIALPGRTQSCRCAEDFQFLVKKIETNYIGFATKAPDRKAYSSMVDSLGREAQTIDPRHCLSLLQTYTNFFQDAHLAVYYSQQPADPKSIQSIFSDTKKILMPEAKVKKYLRSGKRDIIEGIYTFGEGGYSIAIVKSPTKTREYAGFILAADSIFWMPYQVKMEIRKKDNQYSATYYTLDHDPMELALQVTEASFELGENMGVWEKVYPPVAKQAVPISTESTLTAGFSLKKLDNESLLLTLPHFESGSKQLIDSIIDVNREIILNSKNLIIDLRNNLGGATPPFEKIIPFLYTNPIGLEDVSVLATPDNIQAFQSFLDLPQVKRDAGLKAEIESTIDRLTQHKGQVVQIPGDSIHYDTVYTYPEKVAILMDENSASASELFLLRAKQSTKVSTFGQASFGAIDYLDGFSVRLPCGNIELAYPLSRNDTFLKNAADASAIQPDVPIPADTANWIEFVLNYLRTRQ